MIKVDKKSVEKLYCQVYNAKDGHYYDSDECWYCGYQAGILTVLAQLLGHGNISVKDRRVGSSVKVQEKFDLYMELKEKFDETKT